jgi:16S rRNA (cytidine1402-2'-O)-methyltransferase
VVVGPPIEQAPDAADLDSALRGALAHLSVRDAAREVADRLGVPRKAAYLRALALSAEGAAGPRSGE